MGFLPIFYAGAYFLAACVGYALCKVVSAWRGQATAVFFSILSFGACAYIGFFATVLGVGVSPLKGLLAGVTESTVYAVAYLIPGIFGAWLCVKVIRSMAFSRETQ